MAVASGKNFHGSGKHRWGKRYDEGVLPSLGFISLLSRTQCLASLYGATANESVEWSMTAPPSFKAIFLIVWGIGALSGAASDAEENAIGWQPGKFVDEGDRVVLHDIFPLSPFPPFLISSFSCP
jgi:hypothetical protein